VEQISTEQQRDPQSRLLDGKALRFSAFASTYAVKKAADRSGANQRDNLSWVPLETLGVNVSSVWPKGVGQEN
jgi:hypothetical protein